MPDANGHLYLFEALLLRNEEDRRVKGWNVWSTPRNTDVAAASSGPATTRPPSPRPLSTSPTLSPQTSLALRPAP